MVRPRVDGLPVVSGCDPGVTEPQRLCVAVDLGGEVERFDWLSRR
jgi:hypothetical protein